MDLRLGYRTHDSQIAESLESWNMLRELVNGRDLIDKPIRTVSLD